MEENRQEKSDAQTPPFFERRYGNNCGPAFHSAEDAIRHNSTYGQISKSELHCLSGSFT